MSSKNLLISQMLVKYCVSVFNTLIYVFVSFKYFRYYIFEGSLGTVTDACVQ